MPRPVNWLNHEDCPAESDGYGWSQRPSVTYDVPLYMERLGMLDLPSWMRTADGSCDVNYQLAMGNDRPEIYTTSLLSASPANSTATPEPKKLQCRFFARTGHCRFGDQCRFLHESEGQAASVDQKQEKKTWEQTAREAREKREDEEGRRVRVCQFYGTDDVCKKGVHCVNRHIDEDGTRH